MLSPPSQKALLHPLPGLKQKLMIAVTGVLVLAAVLIFGIPRIRSALNTVSADDAYVNGHVTLPHA